MRGLAILPLLLLAMPVGAQVSPQPGSGDPHFQVVQYRPDQVVSLEVAVGFQLVLELASDDPIQSVAIGDSGSWQATPMKSGDRVFVQALLAGSRTNLTVVTVNRRYVFDLAAIASPSPSMPYAVRFRYTTPPANDETDVPLPVGRYELSGDKALRPSAISDDGIHTLIVWPPEVPLPAVFSLDHGKEMVVNGAMRDDMYVIDSINRDLVFRLDDKRARARRFVPPPPKVK